MGTSILTGPILLGQVAAPDGVAATPWAVMPFALVGLATLALLVGVPVVLSIRSEQRKREMEHAERMRAIELGRPFPGDSGWWSPARVAAGIGVGVPIGSFGIAFLAASAVEEAAPFIWPSAGAVGVAAVICGTVLASRLPASTPPPAAPDPHAKPYIDPDAYGLDPVDVAHRPD